MAANFVSFCGQSAHAGSSGKLNRAALGVAFTQLVKKYKESFEIALSSKEEITSKSQIWLPSGTRILAEDSVYSDKEFQEDMVRKALRAQARALEELGPSLYSPRLVDQIESDFHSVKQQVGFSGRPYL